MNTFSICLPTYTKYASSIVNIFLLFARHLALDKIKRAHPLFNELYHNNKIYYEKSLMIPAF